MHTGKLILVFITDLYNINLPFAERALRLAEYDRTFFLKPPS